MSFYGKKDYVFSEDKFRIHEDDVYAEKQFNPAFSQYSKTARELLRSRVSSLEGQALHDYLYDKWMADISPIKAVLEIAE